MKIHPVTKIIAIIALMEEFAKESSSPNPEIESGPKNSTAMPPPKQHQDPHYKNKAKN